MTTSPRRMRAEEWAPIRWGSGLAHFLVVNSAASTAPQRTPVSSSLPREGT